MKNFSPLFTFIILSAFFSIGISLSLDFKSAWILFLLIFYASIFYLYSFQKTDFFSPWKKKFFIFWIFFYPFFNIWVLYMVEYDIIPYSYRFFNTIEHFSVIGSLAFITYGTLSTLFKKVSYIEGVIILLSFLLSIGIGIEVLQYIIRVFLFDPAPTYKLAAYYSDTIADTSTNIIAGIVWSIIINKK